DVRPLRPLTPAALAGPFLRDLDAELTRAGVAIAHLKVFAEAASGSLKAGICRNGERPAVEGALDAVPSLKHRLVVNLRATGAPETLSAAVRSAARRLPGRVRVRHHESFRPAPPQPERRIATEEP
ncbi:MAG TPA: hypothetical protein VHA11_14520, partial [Bryobacteraceae bacterium]|nr:hypothetical protein [Bryobacteraceae bacterium]